MPKTPVQVETARSNPYITKSISKSLLTPCRQVGLSRKKKTPNSANTSLTGSNKSVCGNLETTPLSSNTNDKDEVKTVNTGAFTEAREKKKVSKRLIADEEPPVTKKFCQDLEVVKDESQTNQTLPCDTQNETLLEDNSKLDDKEEAVSKSKVKPKPTPKKNKKKGKSKKANVISEDEDESGDKPSSSEEVPPKRNLRKQVSNKINMINNYDEISHNLKLSPKKHCNSDQEDAAFEALKSLKTYSKKNPKVVRKLNVIEDDEDEETKLQDENKIDCKTLDNNVVDEKTMLKKASKEYDVISTPLIEISPQDDEAFEDSKLLKTYLKKNPRRISRKLNVINDDDDETYEEIKMEKKIDSDNNTVNEKLDETAMLNKTNKEYQAPLTEVTNQEEKLKASNVSVKNTKTIKVKRSLSMKKSSSYDLKHNSIDLIRECSVNLSPIVSSSSLQENLEFVTVSDSEIKELQAKIKEKKKLLEELRRAEVYKKKHNLKELQELTVCWKQGCISALKDLLPLLQSHGSMDMATLLKNLNIPAEKIALSPGGDLI